jgi:hypothetical protein
VLGLPNVATSHELVGVRIDGEDAVIGSISHVHRVIDRIESKGVEVCLSGTAVRPARNRDILQIIQTGMRRLRAQYYCERKHRR